MNKYIILNYGTGNYISKIIWETGGPNIHGSTKDEAIIYSENEAIELINELGRGFSMEKITSEI